ncbi:MAG TPA: hypothetical protein VJN70_15060 [Gemmatimonadaceae bacterium]|nr:hypothetical protein [Gemmatimonadaceae bacterium]
MTGSPADGAPAPTPKQRMWLESLLTRRNAAIGAAAFVVVLAVIAAVRYRSGSDRRNYESLLTSSLDHIVTAQEGFYYDSTKYVTSLSSLPTVHLPPAVHVTLYAPDRRSWWAVATHDRLPAHHCIVWVGKAPTSIPVAARAPENETKPLCFDDSASVARQAQRS